LATQGFFGVGRATATTIAVAIGLGLLLLFGILRHSARDAATARAALASWTDLNALRVAADGGDDAALQSLIDALDRAPSHDSQAVVRDMLHSTRAELRAAACAWMGKHRQAQLAALTLFPRMSDQDWRVRAAAFEAAQQIAGAAPATPKGDAPLRDTPVDQREPVILAWINGWRTSGDVLPALADHCELYADAGGHWLTGTKLAASCLACHAPPDRFATDDFAACASCHKQAHAEWSGSAHARSTSHLNLARINDQTKQVERFAYGPREGLVCTTCHVPVARGEPSPSARTRGEGGGEGQGARGVERTLVHESRSPLSPAISPAYREERERPAGTESLFVSHRFVPATAAACAACHGDTQAEWNVWRANPRPVASHWLPGEVTWDEEGEPQSCVACHLKRRSPRDEPGLRHDFGARRDVPFMRAGLVARIDPPTGGRGPVLVLTNLAGHRYPSGTGRRALRIDVRYDDEEPASDQVLMRLTDSTLPTTRPTQPALEPGEQRRIDLPTRAGAARVVCDVTFERNHYVSGSYELLLHTMRESLSMNAR
jgi:hypothetical protein